MGVYGNNSLHSMMGDNKIAVRIVIMIQENSLNHEVISFLMPHIPVEENSISMQLIEASRGFHHIHQEESFVFPVHVDETQTLNTNFNEENSIVFPPNFFTEKRKSCVGREEKGMGWSHWHAQKVEQRD